MFDTTTKGSPSREAQDRQVHTNTQRKHQGNPK